MRVLTFHPAHPVKAESLPELLRVIEKRVLLSVLNAAGGNVSNAMPALGISRAGVYKVMKRHGITTEHAKSGR